MLGPLTDGTQQRQLMAAAFSAATEIGDEMERGEALNDFLAFVLPADFLPAAMEAAEGIKFELARNPAVHALTRASQAAWRRADRRAIARRGRASERRRSRAVAGRHSRPANFKRTGRSAERGG